MQELLKTYFLYLRHPFRVNAAFAGKESDLSPATLSLPEVLLLSWPFYIMSCFYELFSFNMGAQRFLELSENSRFAFLAESIGQGQSFYVYWLVLKVIFFPLVLWLFVQIWFFLIKVFAGVFDKNDDSQAIHQVVVVALSSYAFLGIPFLGGLIRAFATPVYLIGGMRENLKMTTGQALLVVLTPLFIILFLAMFLAFLVILFFKLL